jgi:hypothetical protein
MEAAGSFETLVISNHLPECSVNIEDRFTVVETSKSYFIWQS